MTVSSCSFGTIPSSSMMPELGSHKNAAVVCAQPLFAARESVTRRAHSHRRWQHRHPAHSDFDPQARRQETRPRTRRHTQYRGGTQPSDRQRSRRTRTTAPWSRQSPGRSALAIVRPSNACFQPVFLTLDLVPSTRPASICP
jgi:hypothetical protein